ncbi:uncharacterized protein LY89DRAFT_729063 [Mollisia scopiformis]|uniref:Uncharacterized protein n=1 Tax=Mollisia scopiformis TaxID=149040 RepID=A0A194XN39_MOLSC|nr:uncharacterized protein LY89DRAFT_729063 [Mollisia scopiformis]KUJ21546.1 hypothetical protein LY89DRAFT_729063 [Mollisia scopiformis]
MTYSTESQPETKKSISFESAETDSSSTGLLEKFNNTEALEDDLRFIRQPPPRYSPRWLMVHICVLLLYTCILVGALFKVWSLPEQKLLPSHDNALDMLYSPMRDAVRYEVKTLHNSVNATSKYKGPPTPEVDKAWRAVFDYGELRINDEDLKHMNRTSVKLADGSGQYVGSPDASNTSQAVFQTNSNIERNQTYHQLHCLWYIFRNVHPEFYTVEPTNVPVIDHLDHCIDSLRNFIQCHATTSVQTYSWLPDLHIPWANFEVDNICVDWDYYTNWVTQHSIQDIYDPHIFVHPTMGPSFPDGKPTTGTKGHDHGIGGA